MNITKINRQFQYFIKKTPEPQVIKTPWATDAQRHAKDFSDSLHITNRLNSLEGYEFYYEKKLTHLIARIKNIYKSSTKIGPILDTIGEIKKLPQKGHKYKSKFATKLFELANKELRSGRRESGHLLLSITKTTLAEIPSSAKMKADEIIESRALKDMAQLSLDSNDFIHAISRMTELFNINKNKATTQDLIELLEQKQVLNKKIVKDYKTAVKKYITLTKKPSSRQGFQALLGYDEIELGKLYLKANKFGIEGAKRSLTHVKRGIRLLEKSQQDEKYITFAKEYVKSFEPIIKLENALRKNHIKNNLDMIKNLLEPVLETKTFYAVSTLSKIAKEQIGENVEIATAINNCAKELTQKRIFPDNKKAYFQIIENIKQNEEKINSLK